MSTPKTKFAWLPTECDVYHPVTFKFMVIIVWLKWVVEYEPGRYTIRIKKERHGP